MSDTVLLWNKAEGRAEKVAVGEVRAKISAGTHQDYEGTKLNLDIGGLPVQRSIYDDQALEQAGRQGTLSTTLQEASATSEAAREEHFSGARNKIKTFGEGILDAMTLGIVEGEGGTGGELRRRYNPGVHTAGELVGIAGSIGVPIAPVGAVAKGAATAGRVVTTAAKGGRAARVAGAAVEGALFGVVDETTHQVADVLLRDKGFAAERIVGAAKMGAILGGAAEGLLGVATAVKAKAKAADVVKAAIPPEETGALVTAYETARKGLDDAVAEHGQRAHILKVFRQEAEEAGSAVGRTVEGRFLASLPDEWYAVRDAALSRAEKAGEKVARFKAKDILGADSKTYKQFHSAWAEYESATAALKDLMERPPKVTQEGADLGGKLQELRQQGAPVREATVDLPATAPGLKGRAGPALRPAIPPPQALESHPALRKYLDDWYVTSHTKDYRGSPVDLAAGTLSEVGERIGGSLSHAGGLPGVSTALEVDSLRGTSNFLDAMTDAWAAHKYVDMAAKEAAGVRTALSKREGSHPVVYWATRRGVQSAAMRLGLGSILGYGMGHAVAGAAVGLMSGRVGRLAAWAQEGKIAAATAVESLLGGGRGRAYAKVFPALKLSYTGDDADATSDMIKKGAQLNTAIQNEEDTRERIRAAMDPILAADPTLATHIEDLTMLRLKNLSVRAPAFILDPGQVPPAPWSHEMAYYNEYEAVAHNPDIAIDQVKTGSLSQAAADSLRENHPAHLQVVVQEVLDRMDENSLRRLTPERRQTLERLLGVPMQDDLFASQQAFYQAQAAERQAKKEKAVGAQYRPHPTMGQQSMAPPRR